MKSKSIGNMKRSIEIITRTRANTKRLSFREDTGEAIAEKVYSYRMYKVAHKTRPNRKEKIIVENDTSHRIYLITGSFYVGDYPKLFVVTYLYKIMFRLKEKTNGGTS